MLKNRFLVPESNPLEWVHSLSYTNATTKLVGVYKPIHDRPNMQIWGPLHDRTWVGVIRTVISICHLGVVFAKVFHYIIYVLKSTCRGWIWAIMMTSSNGHIFPRYWPFVRGIHRSPVNSPHKGQWRGALMFCFICVWKNGWVNNREAADLRRYHAHHDVSVMVIADLKKCQYNPSNLQMADETSLVISRHYLKISLNC